MTMFEFGSILGFVAGLLLLSSGFPMFREQILNPKFGSKGERQSRLLMALGNGIWTVAGVLMQVWPVSILCGVNATIQLIIWIRMKWWGK